MEPPISIEHPRIVVGASKLQWGLPPESSVEHGLDEGYGRNALASALGPDMDEETYQVMKPFISENPLFKIRQDDQADPKLSEATIAMDKIHRNPLSSPFPSGHSLLMDYMRVNAEARLTFFPELSTIALSQCASGSEGFSLSFKRMLFSAKNAVWYDVDVWAAGCDYPIPIYVSVTAINPESAKDLQDWLCRVAFQKWAAAMALAPPVLLGKMLPWVCRSGIPARRWPTRVINDQWALSFDGGAVHLGFIAYDPIFRVTVAEWLFAIVEQELLSTAGNEMLYRLNTARDRVHELELIVAIFADSIKSAETNGHPLKIWPVNLRLSNYGLDFDARSRAPLKLMATEWSPQTVVLWSAMAKAIAERNYALPFMRQFIQMDQRYDELFKGASPDPSIIIKQMLLFELWLLFADSLGRLSHRVTGEHRDRVLQTAKSVRENALAFAKQQR